MEAKELQTKITQLEMHLEKFDITDLEAENMNPLENMIDSVGQAGEAVAGQVVKGVTFMTEIPRDIVTTFGHLDGNYLPNHATVYTTCSPWMCVVVFRGPGGSAENLSKSGEYRGLSGVHGKIRELWALRAPHYFPDPMFFHRDHESGERALLVSVQRPYTHVITCDPGIVQETGQSALLLASLSRAASAFGQGNSTLLLATANSWSTEDGQSVPGGSDGTSGQSDTDVMVWFELVLCICFVIEFLIKVVGLTFKRYHRWLAYPFLYPEI